MIRAAGAVLWREGADGPEVAVVHRPRYDDWSLPKGKAHRGESMPATARREVVEETGHDAALGRWLGRTHYRVDGDEKRVEFWTARAGADVGGVAPHEVDSVAWLPLEDARERITWETDRGILARFLPVETSTVLLVRHARAGYRETWHGPDAERPLDLDGTEQVAGLAATLPAFWLRDETPYVVSAPVRRCVDTVAWAGEVTEEAALGEATFEDGAASVSYVRSLASRGVAVASSQGSVIPFVVETLRREDGLAPVGARASKGSVWVLSFAQGRLLAADYLDAI